MINSDLHMMKINLNMMISNLNMMTPKVNTMNLTTMNSNIKRLADILASICRCTTPPHHVSFTSFNTDAPVCPPSWRAFSNIYSLSLYVCIIQRYIVQLGYNGHRISNISDTFLLVRSKFIEITSLTSASRITDGKSILQRSDISEVYSGVINDVIKLRRHCSRMVAMRL